ncbi:vls recombination cassette Vls3 (plasmid) [Borreliella burgdorferi 118a]|uniref:Variable large protein n=1 Tax=Borreliella burgdorferi 118a TaxID=476210 RepID=A0A7U3YB20_BORBG|nr:vls recombination cassette Vls3 [Borreliella burgdorferi 118a]
MIEAAGGEVKIGEVGTAANKGAAADQESVNGIADGMKEIVDAGGKDALKAAGAAAAGGGGDNAGAGKLFGGAAGADGASDNDIGKAAAAVNAVSGEQILKAIVDAAAGGNKVGAAAGAADNPIAAAIGTNDAQGGGADFGAGGKDALKAAAVGGDKVGKAAGAATNPIAAAIGTNAQGADFAGGMQNSSEKIAAAIVLRGMAKDGKFSLADHNNNDQKAKVKSVVHQRRW